MGSQKVPHCDCENCCKWNWNERKTRENINNLFLSEFDLGEGIITFLCDGFYRLDWVILIKMGKRLMINRPARGRYRRMTQFELATRIEKFSQSKRVNRETTVSSGIFRIIIHNIGTKCSLIEISDWIVSEHNRKISDICYDNIFIILSNEQNYRLSKSTNFICSSYRLVHFLRNIHRVSDFN